MFHAGFFMPAGPQMAGERFQQRLQESLDRLQQTNRLRTQQVVSRPNSVTCRIDGRDFISFSSNDYLGLCHAPEVLQKFSEVALQQSGAGASPLISGRSPQMLQLEQAIAEVEGTAAATIFPSGFAANIGTLLALTGPDDAVFCERENHASLIDGCRASQARFLVFDRSQLTRLDQTLRRRRQQYDQVLLVTDALFSMDGTIPDLPAICDLAEKHDAIVMVDEAHATGVFGRRGSGICEQTGTQDRIAIRMGTLSKAIGSLGGFVAGSELLCQWIANSARSRFFSTALPPAVCHAATAALHLLAEQPGRRERLHRNGRLLRTLLRERNVPLMQVAPAAGGLLSAAQLNPPESPILAVPVGDDQRAVSVSEHLRQRGLLIPAVRPPTVPVGTARLRISLSSEHTEKDLETAADAIAECLLK